MTKTSIAELAEIAGINVRTVITQIRGRFGDDIPQVHTWTSETLLPDDPIGIMILEFLGIENLDNNAIATLERSQITTSEGRLTDIAEAREYALAAITESLRCSIGEYLQASISEAVISGYNQAQETAIDLLASVSSNDINYLQRETQASMQRLVQEVEISQKKGDTLRTRVTQMLTSGQRSSATNRDSINSLLKSIKSRG